MSAIPAAELIARCIAGDDAAQAQFYSEHADAVTRAVSRKLAQLTEAAPVRSDVEDIRHEVFTRLLGDGCRRLRCLKNPESVRAWLVSIAGNSTVDFLRRQARTVKLHRSVANERQEPYCASPAEKAMAEERRVLLNQMLGELPAQDRLILDLYFVHGLKYVEIAEVMGININTASAKLRRAKAKLRELIERDGDVLNG